MRVEFVESVVRQLLGDGVLEKSDSIVAVCAGKEEREFFTSMTFADVTISNLDERVTASDFLPLKWSYQDAQNLSFANDQFDFAFVSDGLHHCTSPHRALVEMYRVARKGIIMFEGRDSLLMRLANSLKLVSEFELEAVVDNDYRFGGVNNTEIPNFIYRWTERELTKTIQSCNPIGRHEIRFFYGLGLPFQTSAMRKSSLKLSIVKLVGPMLTVSAHFCKRLNNLFAMVVLKPRIPDDLWPWIQQRDGIVGFNRGYADKFYKPSTESKQ